MPKTRSTIRTPQKVSHPYTHPYIPAKPKIPCGLLRCDQSLCDSSTRRRHHIEVHHFWNGEFHPEWNGDSCPFCKRSKIRRPGILKDHLQKKHSMTLSQAERIEDQVVSYRSSARAIRSTTGYTQAAQSKPKSTRPTSVRQRASFVVTPLPDASSPYHSTPALSMASSSPGSSDASYDGPYPLSPLIVPTQPTQPSHSTTNMGNGFYATSTTQQQVQVYPFNTWNARSMQYPKTMSVASVASSSDFGAPPLTNQTSFVSNYDTTTYYPLQYRSQVEHDYAHATPSFSQPASHSFGEFPLPAGSIIQPIAHVGSFLTSNDMFDVPPGISLDQLLDDMLRDFQIGFPPAASSS